MPKAFDRGQLRITHDPIQRIDTALPRTPSFDPASVVLTGLVEAIKDLTGIDLSSVEALIQSLGEVVADVVGFFAGLTDFTGWSAMLDQIVGFFSSILDFSTWSAALKQFVDFFAGLLNPTGFLNVLQDVVDFFAGLLDFSSWSAMLSEVVDFFAGLTDFTGWSAMLDQIVGFFSSILDSLGSLDVFAALAAAFAGLVGADGTLNAWIASIPPALTSLAEWINQVFTKPLIGALTGGASLDLGALGVWARGLLASDSRIPANNLFGQVSSSLFGVIPVSHISNEQPNLLTQGAFDSADQVASADGWTWDDSMSYTGGGGALSVTANGTVKVMYCNQSIPVSVGDKIALQAFYRTSGYAGSGTPIYLSLIPFKGAAQQTAVTIGAGAGAASWTQLYGATWTVPTGVTSVRVRLALSSAASAGTVWFDDVRLAKTGLLQQGLVERLTDAWNNFWNSIFGGNDTGKTVDDIYVAGSALTNTAQTAFSNASDALGQLGQLVWNLLNAPAAILGNIAHVVIDGISSIGQFLTGLWNSLTGNTAAEATVSQVATAAASVTAKSNSAITNAQLAQAAAETADDKAVAAQGQTQDVVDLVYQGANGGTATGNSFASVKTSVAAVLSKANLGVSKADTAQATVEAVASSGNMIISPNFEDALIGRTNYTSGASYEYVTDSPHQGTKCLKVTVSQANWNGIYLQPTVATTRFAVRAGDIYSASVQVKFGASLAGKASGFIRLYLRWYNTATNAYQDAVNDAYQINAVNATGGWQELRCWGDCPVGFNALQIMLLTNSAALPGDFFYVDTASLENITEAYSAQLEAAAAASSASEAIVNAETADGKAVAAQSDADLALADAAAAQAQIDITSVDYTNLVSGSTFDGADAPWPWWLDGGSGASLDATQSHSGVNSLKIVSTSVSGKYVAEYQDSSDSRRYFRAAPGDVIHMELWAKRSSSYVQDSSVGPRFRLVRGDGSLANNTYADIRLFASDMPVADQWVKFETQVVVPDSDWRLFYFGFTNGPADYAGSVWVDDVVVRRVSLEALTAQLEAEAAQADATIGIENAATADGKAVLAQNAVDLKSKDFANLVAGSDFEDTHPWALASYTAVASDQAHSGAKSLKITAHTGSATSFLVDGVAKPFAVAEGDKLFVSAWVRKDSSFTSTDFRIRFGKEGNAFAASFQINPATANTWTEYTQTWTVPAGMAQLIPSIVCADSAGTVWIDDIVIRKVSPEAVAADGKAVAINQAVYGQDTPGASIAQVKITGLVDDLGAVLQAASDADDKAVAAQADADRANTALNVAIQSGANLAADNGTFSNDYMWTPTSHGSDEGSRSSAYAKVGTYSWLHTANGSVQTLYMHWTPERVIKPWPTSGGRKYHVEAWVYTPTTNSHAAGNISIHSAVTSTGPTYAYPSVAVNTNTLTKGAWNKISGVIDLTPYQNAYEWYVYLRVDASTTTNDKFYWDQISVVDITAPYDAAVAAQDAADTAQDAADDAQDAADAAQLKAVKAAGLAGSGNSSGGNQFANAGFENTDFAIIQGSYGTVEYSTEQAFAGTRSLKLTQTTANQWTYYLLAASDTDYMNVVVTPGSTYYMEAMVRGHSGNTQSDYASAFRLGVFTLYSDGSAQTTNYAVLAANATAMNSTWIKISGYVRMPNNAASVRPFLAVGYSVPVGHIYYFDRVVFREYTDTQDVIDNVHQAVNGGTTTGTSLSLVKDNVLAVWDKANLGVDNAETADGKAQMAQAAVDLRTSDATNLVAGLDFDDSLLVPLDLPEGYGYSFDTTEKHSGTKSLKIVASAASYRYVAYDYERRFAVKPGDFFALELWARRSSDYVGEDGAGPRFRLIGGNGSTLRHIQLSASNIGAANTWVKLTATIAVPDDGTTQIRFGFNGPPVGSAGSVWVDDVVVRKVLPETIAAQDAADTAQDAADDAQDAADGAQGAADGAKNLAAAATSSGSNIVNNPGFEDTEYLLSGGTYDTSVKRNGSRSLKQVSVSGSYISTPLFNSYTSSARYLPCAPGDVFYVEGYVRQPAGQTGATSTVYIQAHIRVGDSTSYTNSYVTAQSIIGTSVSDNAWTKLSGYMTMPAGAFEFVVRCYVHANNPSGKIFYWDDILVREVTAPVKTNQALYGPTANDPASAILTSAVPYGVDATKLSGTLNSDRIPTLEQSKVNGLPTGTRVDSTLTSHTEKIQELEAGKDSAANQGRVITANFNNYAAGQLATVAPDWLVYYSGSGTSTVNVFQDGYSGNQIAGFYPTGSNADRYAKIIYRGSSTDTTDEVTLSDYQKIRGSIGWLPYTGTKFWAMGRVMNTGTSYSGINNYVWARLYPGSGVLQYLVDLGCVINGTEYVWVEGVQATASSLTPDFYFLCGVSGNLRTYQVWSGTTLLATFTENGKDKNNNTIPYSNYGENYRRWGALAEVKYLGGQLVTSGTVSAVVVSDNITPDFNGSVARMYRSGGTVTDTITTTDTALPNSFFTNPEIDSLDIDINLTEGSFTVTKSKMYLVTARVKLNTYLDANGYLNLQKYNGTSWATVQRGPSVWGADTGNFAINPADGFVLTGTWLQYLNAGEKVRLSANVDRGSRASVFTGGGTTETYFTISGLQ